LGDRIYATAAVGDDGVFYVGSDAKKFVAVGPDGGVRWKLDVGAEADTAAAFAPDGTLVFAAGATVFAVRKGGDVAWRFRGRGKVFTAPAVMDDGTVVVGSQDHHVVAIRAGGALGWAVDLGHDVDGGPAVGDDGSIFVGTDGGEVVRLDKDGRVGWRVKVGGFVRGALSLARNGDVLVGVYGPSPRVLRLVGDDGSERGSYAVRGTGAREFGVHGGPLEDDDGALAFGTQDDQVTVVEADGSLRWSFRTGGDVDAPLTLLTDGTLLVGSEDGKVYAFR
jgi:outer membrane protein assembly factor BamB